MRLLVTAILCHFLFFCEASSITDSESITSANQDPITVEVCGNVPSLCEGQCTNITTDLNIKVTGGTPPYIVRIGFNWNPVNPQNTSSFQIRDVQDSHVIRFCHDNSITSPGGEEFPGDTTQFSIPTGFFPGEIAFRSIEDATGCTSTDFGGIASVDLMSNPGTFMDYQVDVSNHICDEFVLPPITPAGPTTAFYTEPNGNGMRFLPGDLVDFNTINLPSGDLFDTLYVFDPNDVCMSQMLFPFFINLGPDHDTPADISQCDTYTLPPYPGPIATPMAQYATDIDFTAGSLMNPGDIISASTRVYLRDMIAYPTGDCVFLDSFEVEIIAMPFSGVDDTFTVCSGEPTIITDPAVLLGNPDAGGLWTSDRIIPDVDLNNPINIELTNTPPGEVFLLTYTLEVPGCPITAATLTIESVAAPFAGDSTQISLCRSEGPQDFFALVGNPELGGFWSQTGGPPTVISDFSQVDFSLLPLTTYSYIYSIAAVNNCPAQIAELVIDLNDGPNAGRDNTEVVCKGDILDLTTLLSSDADSGGDYLVDGFIPLPNGLWDSNMILIDEGTVNIEYILPSVAATCPADTALFVIELVLEPSAGLPMMAAFEECEGTVLTLPDLLVDADPNGTFRPASDLTMLIGAQYTVGSTADRIAYIVPPAGSCAGDTSFFDITPIVSREVAFDFSQANLCNGPGECVQLEVILNLDSELDFVLEARTETIPISRPLAGNNFYTVCIGGNFGDINIDTLFIGNQSQEDILVSAVSVSPDCPSNILPATPEILTVSEAFEASFFGTVCEGQTTDIGGVQYGSSTTLAMQTINGCDSIINIVIDTFPNDIGFIERQFCEGAQGVVLGQVFLTDTTGLFTFPGQSVFGCDSTAMVDIDFSTVAEGMRSESICPGGFVIVEGERFDESRLMGMVDFVGGSVVGCDSTFLVTVDVLSPGIVAVDTMICRGDTFVIEGDTYDENNTTGMTTLPFAAANSCDSIAMVTVSILDFITDSRSFTICPGSSVTVGDMTFDENNTNGEATIVGNLGCDTIASVTITVENLITDNRNFTICPGESIVVGNTVFDENNLTGDATILGITGCDTIAAVTVIVSEPEMMLRDDAICPGEEVIINGQTFSDSNPTGMTSVSNVLGCDSIVYDVALTVLELQGNIEVTPIGDNQFQLLFNGDITDVSLEWAPSDILDCDVDCTDPIASIEMDTDLTLIATDVNGCQFDFSTAVTFEPVVIPDSTIIIYQPTSIVTGDTNNGTFFVQSNITTTIASMAIYDRWGNQVFLNEAFQSNDMTQGWDGRRGNDGILEQGVYVYNIQYEDDILGPQVVVGSITLIR